MPRIALATLAREMEFVARTGSGHEVRMDAAEKSGGNDFAARPAEMPFVGLAGCTGMDTISILRKMRQDVATFSVDVEGLERTEEHPKYWTHIQVTFIVTGEVEQAKLERAIDLSRTRYCSVSTIMKPKVKIDYRYELNGEMHEMPESTKPTATKEQ